MRTSNALPKIGLRLVVGLLGAAVGAGSAQAIPAFARKYQTSCQTCHVAYPKLNPFGQTFRLLGYHMPGETEAQVKEPDVPLGAPAYKRVWPKAVWPGAIPSHVPLAITSEFQVQDTSMVEGDSVDKVQGDFLFPSEVTLVAAGSAGDHVSFFGELAFEREIEDGTITNETGVEHIDFRFIRPIHDSTAFNVKIGEFQPELVTTFDHARRLTVANYDSMFAVQPVHPGGAEAVGGGHHGGGGPGVALPAVATGFEMYGVIHGRLLWTAGLVNGSGPGQDTLDGNSDKDYYGRLAYKWGGLAFDGSNMADYAAPSKNWRERSFSLGLLGYHGDNSGIVRAVGADEEGHGEEAVTEAALSPMTGAHEDEPVAPAFVEGQGFSRWGVDFNGYWDDLNVFGAWIEGRDDINAFAAGEGGVVGALLPEISGQFTYDAWFLEADAVLGYPWFHGALRYENVDLPSEEVTSDWQRATLSLTGLVRANVKTTLEYSRDLNESRNHALWLNFGIAY